MLLHWQSLCQQRVVVTHQNPMAEPRCSRLTSPCKTFQCWSWHVSRNWQSGGASVSLAPALCPDPGRRQWGSHGHTHHRATATSPRASSRVTGERAGVSWSKLERAGVNWYRLAGLFRAAGSPQHGPQTRLRLLSPAGAKRQGWVCRTPLPGAALAVSVRAECPLESGGLGLRAGISACRRRSAFSVRATRTVSERLRPAPRARSPRKAAACAGCAGVCGVSGVCGLSGLRGVCGAVRGVRSCPGVCGGGAGVAVGGITAPCVSLHCI